MKKRTYASRGERWLMSMRTFAYNFFLIEHLVHNLPTMITRFLVSLKISCKIYSTEILTHHMPVLPSYRN